MSRIISGIQSSGQASIGNYLGAIQNFVKLQDENDLFLFVANLHSITVEQDKKELLNNTKSIVATYIACGIDYHKVKIFIQSEIFAHTQLAWIFQCNSYLGELSRMTQFKDKSKNNDNNNVGLFTYPVLMAADILLYDAAYVPVGEDQKQHLELTRDIATRFNNKYGETFVVPEPLINKQGSRIMSLSDPTKKMSKSMPKGCIFLLDDDKTITKKVKSAVTDTFAKIKYDTINQPGISNLLTIYACFTDCNVEDIERKYENETYATLKEDLANLLIEKITPIRERYQEVLDNGEVDLALESSFDYVNKVANKKVMKVMNKVGLKEKRK